MECIKPINQAEIDKAYEEISEEQAEEWKKLPKEKKTKILKWLIEFIKEMRSRKDEGEYKMDLAERLLKGLPVKFRDEKTSHSIDLRIASYNY
ncbi:MAG: hypothetical protein QMD71_01685 [bacterium]|nr:hypothetical protein [bacterium]